MMEDIANWTKITHEFKDAPIAAAAGLWKTAEDA